MSIPKITPYTLPSKIRPLHNKVNWSIRPQSCVLLVHDMQQYFVDFYDIDSDPIKTVIQNIQQLIDRARAQQIPVIYTAQPANQDPKDRALLTDFWGEGLQEHHNSHQLLDALAPHDGEKIYTKWRYSAFQKSTLEEDLKAAGKDQIIICGVYAHIGILSTALDAFMRDIQAFVIEDATADFSPEEQVMASHWIAGRCGAIRHTQTCLQAFDEQPSDWLKALICNVLQTPSEDISEACNLTDWGLDSIRLMQISDQLAAKNYGVDFIELGQDPCIKSWRKLLTT